ncbi:MAG: hypothetical protein H6Q36_303 [Chloroflexi bacterium]|nr:hypothetical protein [Chloroflexota bacterium]
MSHDDHRRLAAGRILEDLDAAESAVLDDHLAACEDCRTELGALGETAALLALAAPQRRPPASLLERVTASISELGDLPAARPATTDALATTALAFASDAALAWSPPPGLTPRAGGARAVRDGRPAAADGRPRDHWPLRTTWTGQRWTSVAGLALAAVLVVAVAGFGLNTVALQGRLAAAEAAAETALADADAARAVSATARAEAGRARAEADAAQDRTEALTAEMEAMSSAVGVAMAPGHRTAALTAEPAAPSLAAWTVYVPGTTQALLVARGLPPAPAGHVYQLWYADAAGVHAMATFTCTAGTTCVVPFGVDLGGAAAAMVTVEPEGGSAGQPGPQIAFGELEG